MYFIMKGEKDQVQFYLSAGDDKFIFRDTYKIDPPIEENFKMIVDK